ncbi:hypothetical protein ASE70_15135 [Sphingomonas sp. Leaf22]|uniref:hypothetical protein n=1 Tax=Sphingomonas sp. Leaf22 TaxID=1735687 RepID=UPI0006F9A439|nr:hypothetical protein [Sphingomonas sp. Leaf22]KQM92246.1 hypothetical protein ASE70_15135 [Sphingomonas sp. Leaf22]
MGRNDRIVIDLALAILDEQHAKARAGKRQTHEVRLALHVLRPCVPRDWLVSFWEACGLEDGIHRQQDMTRTLNGIRLRVKVDD